MTTLDRKLLRDLRSMIGQGFAIAAVFAAGTAIFIMARGTLSSMHGAKLLYYSQNQFADVFGHVVRAPVSIAGRIRKIPGVGVVQHRIVDALTLDMPGLTEPATGQILSLPADPDSGLNQVTLTDGRWPDPGREGEVVVGEPFAEAHELKPGDTIDATLHGRRRDLTVVGIGLSPDFVIAVQPGSMFSDDRRFGIFWAVRRHLAAAADMDGAFNNFSLTLTSDAIEPEVIRQIDDLLAPYGGTGAYGRDVQMSARYVEDEIKQLGVMSRVAPAMFLGVAAFLLNISLRRLLTLQREQIAVLKAFGYGNQEVGWHFTKLVSSIVLIGTLVGCLLGTVLARWMTEMYTGFYKFPTALFDPGVGIYIVAVLLALGCGLVGVFSGLRTAVRLPPAEAMRPEPPATYRPTLVERLGLQKLFSQPTRISMREIERHPFKAALTAFGVALACGVLIIGNFGKDSMDYLTDFEFSLVQRDDAKVTFIEPVPHRALHELRSIPGVLRAEPIRAVAVRMRHENRDRQLGIFGISEDADLLTLRDFEEQAIPIGGGGLLLSDKVAEVLHLKVGDTVRVEVLEKDRPVRQVRVSGLIEDYSGMNAYMEIGALNRLLQEGPVLTGASLTVDSAHASEVYGSLKDRPAVAAVSVSRVSMQALMDSIGENLLRMRLINVTFATIIAVGVVYCSSIVAFSERGRDLATLRVIGLTRSEVTRILLGEQGFLTLVAIPVGIGIGFAICALVVAQLTSELYRIPLVVPTSTWASAALVILASFGISAAFIIRRIRRLDLVSALKVRE